MTQYFLGVDVGASKSHAMIADETGKVLSLSLGNGGNHEGIGLDGFHAVILDITGRALQQAGIRKEQIRGMGFGLAGYDWPSDRAPLKAEIEKLAIPAPFELVNDAVIGLIAGASQRWGISVVAGTGNNCRGRDQNGREGRIAGISVWSGEYGGGGDLVEYAMQRVCLSWTKRGPDTLLTEKFLKRVGAPDVLSLLEGLTRGRYILNQYDAPLVFETASQGDPVALAVLRWMGRELGDLAVGVIRQLNFENVEFEVVLTGSLYKGSPLITDAMRETIHAVAPRAQLIPLDAPPVVGGVMLGMEQAGLSYSEIRLQLIGNAKRLLDNQQAHNHPQ